jgi:hypothetical protein
MRSALNVPEGATPHCDGATDEVRDDAVLLLLDEENDLLDDEIVFGIEERVEERAEEEAEERVEKGAEEVDVLEGNSLEKLAEDSADFLTPEAEGPPEQPSKL